MVSMSWGRNASPHVVSHNGVFESRPQGRRPSHGAHLTGALTAPVPARKTH